LIDQVYQLSRTIVLLANSLSCIMAGIKNPLFIYQQPVYTPTGYPITVEK